MFIFPTLYIKYIHTITKSAVEFLFSDQPDAKEFTKRDLLFSSNYLCEIKREIPDNIIAGNIISALAINTAQHNRQDNWD